ncbi:MAG: polysaccharide biosynthesis/export family protein, partial [Fervidobacterium sp.]|nr:polysaccharide biosynthesis/export family protein [Fervidobacterium sp.]
MKKVAFFLFLFILFAIAFSNVVRVGDTIVIEVFGEPNFTKTLTVSTQGTISYPYAGTVKVAGLTVEQIKSIIEQTVRRFVKEPIVTVYIAKQAPLYIYLQGAINRVVDVTYIPNLTLTKLFSILGFSVNSEIDFSRVTIIRPGKSTTYNLLPFFYGDYIKDDPILSEGDIVYLPPLTSDMKVQVSGAYTLITPFEPGLTLRSLLLKLGPLNKENAQLENAILVIDNKAMYVNLEDVIYGKSNYDIKPGATIYIPKREERYVYILGYIPNPGVHSFAMNEEMTLSLAIVKAGGITKDNEKWIEKIVITTPDGKSKEYTKEILQKGNELKLVSGSAIEIKKYAEFRVYLTGDLQTGVITFEPDEPRTLAGLLTKIGGIKTDQFKWIESIKVNGNVVDKTKLESYTLKDKDVVEIKKYPEFKVYISGDFVMQSQVVFEPDEPKTLQQLFVKIGGLKTDQFKWIESIKINGNVVDKTKLESYTLKDKDVVEIKRYAEFRVYLTGDLQTGVITFEPDEPR